MSKPIIKPSMGIGLTKAKHNVGVPDVKTHIKVEASAPVVKLDPKGIPPTDPDTPIMGPEQHPLKAEQAPVELQKPFKEKQIIITMKNGQWISVDFIQGDYDMPIVPREISQARRFIEVTYNAERRKLRRESIQKEARQKRELKEKELVAAGAAKAPVKESSDD